MSCFQRNEVSGKYKVCSVSLGNFLSEGLHQSYEANQITASSLGHNMSLTC